MKLIIPLNKILIYVSVLYLCDCYKLKSVPKGYYGSQVLRINPKSIDQLELLQSLIPENNYDFWIEPRDIGFPVDIMAAGESLDELKRRLTDERISFEIFIADVEYLVHTTGRENQLCKTQQFSWEVYHTYSEITSWMELLAFKNPLTVSVYSIGKSYNGKYIKIAKLSNKLRIAINKPAIWVEGGMHGREWIAPAVVTYMLNELTGNSSYKDIVEQVDFYFLPVVNPDGYEYTFIDDDTRLWKKTRSKTNSTLGCVGVDLDRNWSFHWNASTVSPCSNDFPGNYPFSEPEIKNVKSHILDNARNIKAYLTFTSYAQLWLYPWGYTITPNKDCISMKTLADKAVSAMYEYNGTRYLPQPMCTRYGSCSFGDSIDWMKGFAHIKYPFQVKLPDKGSEGFLLKPSHIIPTGEEALNGLLTVAQQVISDFKGVLSNDILAADDMYCTINPTQ